METKNIKLFRHTLSKCNGSKQRGRIELESSKRIRKRKPKNIVSVASLEGSYKIEAKHGTKLKKKFAEIEDQERHVMDALRQWFRKCDS
jgi:hypothetical protein